jgi:hypothetical protein
MSEIISLKLERRSIPVEIELDNGQVLKMKIVEMTSLVRDQYLDLLSARATLGPDGKPTKVKVAGMIPDLLTRCLVKEDNSPVDAKMVNAWPATVADKLFDAAQELNALSRKDKEPEKNVSVASDSAGIA